MRPENGGIEASPTLLLKIFEKVHETDANFSTIVFIFCTPFNHNVACHCLCHCPSHYNTLPPPNHENISANGLQSLANYLRLFSLPDVNVFLTVILFN